MKRFTTFLMATLFAFAALAQNVVVEELWNHSARSAGGIDPITGAWKDGPAPDWIGGTTERGMTQFDGKIYIPSRNDGKKILVLDAQTGSLLNTINLPEEVSGALFAINSIAVTMSGDLLVGNLTVDTKAVEDGTENPIGHFKVYRVELDPTGTNYENITNIIKWHNYGDDTYPITRMGDNISFYGDIAADANGYLLAAVPGTPYVAKFDVTAGVVNENPVMIKLLNSVPPPAEGTDVNLGTAPYTSPVNADLFIADGKDLVPSIYNMEGEVMTSLIGGKTVLQGNGNGAEYFQFESRDFLIANSTVWDTDPKNAFQLFEVPAADFSAADSITMLPVDGLGAIPNTSFVYPVAVDVLPDQVLAYVFAPNNGIAAYKITIGTGTSVNENVADKVSFYPNPATNVVNFTTEMAWVKVYDMGGKFVREFKDVTQINVSDLRGTYVIHATDKSGIEIKKVLIVK